MKNKFYWVPRVLGVVYILFLISFFTIKFDQVINLPLMFGALLVYGVLLCIAWKHELIGGILFLVIGTILTFLPVGEGMGPIIILGILFIVQSHLNKPRIGSSA